MNKANIKTKDLAGKMAYNWHSEQVGALNGDGCWEFGFPLLAVLQIDSLRESFERHSGEWLRNYLLSHWGNNEQS
jgi:hypothetical protein